MVAAAPASTPPWLAIIGRREFAPCREHEIGNAAQDEQPTEDVTITRQSRTHRLCALTTASPATSASTPVMKISAGRGDELLQYTGIAVPLGEHAAIMPMPMISITGPISRAIYSRSVHCLLPSVKRHRCQAYADSQGA